MSAAEPAATPDLPDGARHSRAYDNTLVLFEWYWVEGSTLRAIGERIDLDAQSVGLQLRNRGIPTRTKGDANRLTAGKTTLERLRWKYLSPFQQSLAAELGAVRDAERAERLDAAVGAEG